MLEEPSVRLSAQELTSLIGHSMSNQHQNILTSSDFDETWLACYGHEETTPHQLSAS